MTKSNNRSRVSERTRSSVSSGASIEDVAVERALEGLFRLSSGRRGDARQAAVVGAVVSRAGYAVLRSLADAGTLTLGRIATACAMDAATASRQVAQLESEGLVSRSASVDDARRVEIELTPRGHEVYELIVRFRLSHMAGVLEQWSADDRATLAALVDRLVVDLSSRPFPHSLD